MGGIISGIFTATESAAIGALYAFIITFFVYRDISIIRFKEILYRTFRTLSMVMFLIAASSGFGWLLALLKVPAMATDFILAVSPNDITTLLLINLILLLLGMVMDMAPLILITTPILLPIAVSIGMDPVHFGVVLVLNLAIGLVTPPVGSVLFVGSAIGRLPIEKVAKSMLPFYAVMIFVLLLTTFIPSLVMWLPQFLAK